MPIFQSVVAGDEYLRVFGLPRRPIPDPAAPESLALAREITARLKRVTIPFPLKPGGHIFATQALALKELYDARGLLAPIRVGGGKAQPHSEPVLLERGWTPMGDVLVGDRVFGSDGRLHDVLAVHRQGVRPVYEVEFSDGAVVRCDEGHLWTFQVTGRVRPYTKTTLEWLSEPLSRRAGAHRANRVFAPLLSAPIQRPSARLPIDPYTLGLLLGDGGMSQRTVNFTSMDVELVDALVLPGRVRPVQTACQSGGRATQYNLTQTRNAPRVACGAVQPNPLSTQLTALGLLGKTSHTKFIPPEYLCGDAPQRLALLQGLMDTDGSVNKSAAELTTASQTLADGVQELVESLGGTCRQTTKVVQYRGAPKAYQRLYIKLPAGLVPFRLARKADAYTKGGHQHGPVRAVVDIRRVGEEECSCISVSAPDHLYVTRHHVLTHNSLLAYLAFAVMGPKRPMLIVPASMVAETRAGWSKFERDWHGPRLADLTLLSYEKVSNPSSGAKVLPDGAEVYADIITRHNPDMIVCDEVHRFGEVSAAGTRRIGRFLAAAMENRQAVTFVGMSGTFIRRSLKDGAHIAEWALGQGAPLPLEWEELQSWADACDARPSAKGKRTDYGALLKQLSPEELAAFDSTEDPDDARGIVVGAIGRRILETPGVIGSQDGPLTIPARLDAWEIGAEDPAIEDEYRKLLEGEGERAAWCLPDGTLLPDAKALARPLTTLGLGFYQLTDPPPPPEYREAQSAWSKIVRETIRYRPGLCLDSEWMVRDAVERGVLPEFQDALTGWRNARAAYTARTGLREPPSVPLWVSDECLREVEQWLKGGSGLIWVSFICLGERLSRELKIPYFGAGKTDARGRHVTKLKGEPAVVSIASVGTGTDGLQFHYARNLWLGAPSEQPLARTHRPGQEAEVVYNDVYIGAIQHHRRFWRAVQVAENFAGAISRQAQKLQYLQNNVPRTLEGHAGRRWGASVDVDFAGEDA